MAHTLLFTLGYNAPEDRILPEGYDWSKRRNARRRAEDDDRTRCGRGRSTSTSRRTTPRSKAPARTTRPAATACPNDPNGKLDIARHAGYWLRDDDGKVTKALQHICWDGCMFPNATMMQPQTWNDVLGAMIAVSDAHGWD